MNLVAENMTKVCSLPIENYFNYALRQNVTVSLRGRLKSREYGRWKIKRSQIAKRMNIAGFNFDFLNGVDFD